MKVLKNTKIGLHKTETQFALVDLAYSCKSKKLEYKIFEVESPVALMELNDETLFTLHNERKTPGNSGLINCWTMEGRLVCKFEVPYISDSFVHNNELVLSTWN